MTTAPAPIPRPSQQAKPDQFTMADVKAATPEQLVAALEAGQLVDVMNTPQRNHNARSSMVANNVSPSTGEAAKR